MQRDKPPGRTVGFGLTERDLPNTEGEQQGPDPESGVFARALHDNPLLKFFAVGASAMVSGALAGQLIRKGGQKVGRRVIQEAAKPGVSGTRAASSIKSFREFQSLLDEWQGVARTIKDPNDPFSDQIIQRSGFFFSEAERANRRAGGLETAAEWTTRDEIQQRMVKLSRRLPYELPGAYLSQRIITDKVLGVEEEGPDWTNPVDVIGDFAQQSIKNLAFGFLPFEAAGGSAVQGWRRAMTMNPSVQGGFKTGAQAMTVGLNRSLKLVGHESSDLIATAVNKGSRSAGAASTALQESAARSSSLVEQLHKMRHGEGGFKGWMDRVARGTEEVTFGPFGHTKVFAQTYRAQYNKLASGGRPQATMLERMAESINRLGGGQRSAAAQRAAKARGVEDPFLESEFYKGLAESEYRKLLGRRLSAAGVDDQIAVEFANKAHIKGLPQQYNAKTVIDQRIGWDGATLEGVVPKDADATKYWLKSFTSKLAPQFGDDHAQKISQALTKSVRLADAEFSTNINTFRDTARNMWRNSYDEVISPQAKATLGMRKQAYRDFGEAMSPANAEWMVRQAARRAGIETVGERGSQVSTSLLRKSLSARGLDASDRRQLRAFLVHKGDISKPWNPQGFNALGLRAMSVQEGLNSKYFGNVNPEAEDFDPIAAQIKRLAEGIKRTDYDAEVLDRLKVGGVYRTMSGGVVDFSPITRAAKTFGQTLSNEFQIPFIHLKPAMLLGAGNKFAIENSPWIQFSPQFNRQPFLGAMSETDTAAGHFWFRSNRGTKGKVTAIGQKEGSFFSRVLEGQYRPRDTDPYSMAGRYMRLAVGDTGRRPETPRTGWRKWAAVDEYQPDSLLGKWKRFRQRRDDHRNVSRVASRYKAGDPSLSPAQEAEAYGLIEAQWRTQGSFGRNIVREATEGTNLHRGTHFRDATGKWVSYLDATETQLASKTREFWEQSPEDLGLISKSQKIMHDKTRTATLKRWQEASEGIHAPAPAAMRPHGIHQRIDQWRMDLMRYSMLTSGLSKTADEFSGVSSQLLREIDEMRFRGGIRSQDVAEARAAVGSIQLNYLSMSEHATSKTTQQLRLDIGRRLRESKPALTVEESIRLQGDPEFAKQASRWSVASLLDDTADYAIARGPTGQESRRFLGRHFGTSDYEFSGTDINPFGGGRPQVYVPTFGTSLQRNARGALKSTAGIGTWNDPNNFSGAGMVSTHLLTRLDRGFFAPFGMSLDASQFSGPMDYFARGMVGKRMLPLFAGGATLMTADRTLGGMINEKDENGERVYSPFFIGGVAGGIAQTQVGMAGMLPGGQTAEEKAHELYEGDVAVRKGRWWPLGNTPWRGGRVQYYRPSWYQRMQAAPQYTDQTFGSPAERLAFGYDFSPLRPFDPYRFEREHYEDRPYPVTGEYFTGPWGPLTPVLNATLGKVLKPQKRMHEEETALNLSRFQQVGMYGMAAPSTGVAVPGEAGSVLGLETPEVSPYAVGGAPGPTVGQTIGAVGPVTSSGEVSRYSSAAGTPAYVSGSRAAQQGVFAGNQRYTQAAGVANTTPIGYPFQIPVADARNPYAQAYARRPANVMPALMPDEAGDLSYQVGELAYRAQEFAGIYGFGFGAIRSSLGLGDQDYAENVPQLSQASLAYGSSRQFWDWNLGGLGDFPTPIEGDYANLQLSEVVRRFIPRPRRHNMINPIQNSVGLENPWLPGNDYMTNFQWGDPYAAIPEGELRLPGQGYERLHGLRSDETGRYGRADRFRILADVAPYSDQFRQAAKEARGLPGFEEEFVETMGQVAERRREHTFAPYKYKYSTAEELDMGQAEFRIRQIGENLQHANTYFNTKFMPNRTAVEDWERNDVYGASFAQWQNPISDFLMPAVHRATQRNPIAAAGGLALIGRMMGATPRAKALGTMVGGTTGFLASALTDAREAITGDRYIPANRRRELAMEEYSDILQYTKAQRGYNMAQQAGNAGLASQFNRQMRSTMYGADLEGGTLAELTAAIPKRKREHFAEFLDAPEPERERILSTAGRLERRIYQRAWGMPVEERPDLDEYFEQHELPDPEWEGWDPRMNMDLVKIKMIQNQGLDASQMGYYPQQIEEANLINPSYPDFHSGTSGNVRARLQQLMSQHGAQGSVREVRTPFPGVRLKVDSGVYA